MLDVLKGLDGGTYTLIIRVLNSLNIRVGCLGYVEFDAGLYTYTGSALNRKLGLYHRVLRHLNHAKRVRWHIDYLLSSDGVSVSAICVSHSLFRFECFVAEKIMSVLGGFPIIGFGCSDCNCESHLHFFSGVNFMDLLNMVYNVYYDLGLNPVKIVL